MAFGSLLIYDLKNCLSTNLNDKNILQYFINELIQIMNMTAIGPTVFEYFEPNEFNILNDLVGYSITQIISMSSITIHICEGSKNVYIDIFTCCVITDNIINKINNLIIYIFNPDNINHRFIERP
jgi:S-adenosylmethionine/arginine decarboxylase-like enzyme